MAKRTLKLAAKNPLRIGAKLPPKLTTKLLIKLGLRKASKLKSKVEPSYNNSFDLRIMKKMGSFLVFYLILCIFVHFVFVVNLKVTRFPLH
jgi:hypothetical protein